MSKRILVADNDLVTQIIIGRLLKAAGHSCVMVGDGKDAWDLLAFGAEFDLVISDMQMSDMSGLELLERMRTDNRTAKVPFVLMSGGLVDPKNDTSLEEACLELGHAKFVIKPYFGFVSLIAQMLGEDEDTDNK